MENAIGRLRITALLTTVALLTTAGVGSAQTFEAVPEFEQCSDDSYTRAVNNGITLGVASVPPYSSIDPNSKQAVGLDIEINEGALKWMGVTTIRYEVAPFGQLMPMLLAARIDVVATNIHITPDRTKVVSFSGPAWWYGPAIIVRNDAPSDIKSFEDLKGRLVGAVGGSAADEYLRHIGAKLQPYPSPAEEFSALSQGRIDAVLEDDIQFLEFTKNVPDSKLEVVSDVEIPEELIYEYGYGYARYAFRKEDCTLRAAYTQALAEMRGNGSVSAILANYNLGQKNLMYFLP